MKDESTDQISARLAVVARNIQDTASELIAQAKVLEDATGWKLDLNEAEKIVRMASVLMSAPRHLEALAIKAKSIAEVLRDEVYEMPEALKRDEL
jgi:hypothetical protein